MLISLLLTILLLFCGCCDDRVLRMGWETWKLEPRKKCKITKKELATWNKT
jgi:hypothetical protein